jgi:hypothetical protein
MIILHLWVSSIICLLLQTNALIDQTLLIVLKIIIGIIIMSMYSQFKTDSQLEKTGICVDYGTFRITLARAGGSNLKFQKVYEFLTKPYRRLIEQDNLPIEIDRQISRTLYARAVIQNWEIKLEDETWKQGIEGEDGSLLEYTEDNVVMTLEKLPDLLADIQRQANRSALFKASELEEDSKN